MNLWNNARRGKGGLLKVEIEITKNEDKICATNLKK